MTHRDLAAVRTLITERRHRVSVVAAFRDELHMKAQDGLNGGWATTVYRCDEPHVGNRRPKIAEVINSGTGLLFISKIPWMASDQLTLRPWMREHLLGAGLDETSLQLCLSDDGYLADWLDHLDEWEAGQPRRGERWLVKAPPTFVVERVEVGPPLGSLGLWLRCPRHPDAYEQLDPIQVIADTRRTLPDNGSPSLS